MTRHDDKVAGMRRNLQSKTGRSVEEWIAALQAADLPDRAAQTAWLKGEGLGHFQARLVLADLAAADSGP